MCESLHKVEDAGYVGNLNMQRVQTMVSGSLGLQMETLKLSAQAGHLVPNGIVPAAQRELHLTNGSNGPTKAARQRENVERKWQLKKQAADTQAMKDQEQKAMAARHSALPAAAASPAGLQSVQLPASQSATLPSSGIHPASSSQPAHTVPSEYAPSESQQVNHDQASCSRPAYLPVGHVPGYDVPPWTDYLGKFASLNGEYIDYMCLLDGCSSLCVLTYYAIV